MPTLAVNLATESDTALRVNINGRVEVRSALEASSALSITPVGIDDTHLFNFPTQGSFNASAIVGPGWQLYFYNAVTGLEETVFADTGFTLKHAQPITVNRRGEMPVMYVQENVAYKVVLKNQSGVEKHRLDYFLWPDAVQRFSVLGIAVQGDQALAITPA